MSSDNTYSTVILTEKTDKFFELIRKLGIDKNDVKLTDYRKDFSLYDIDLSKYKSDPSFKHIRHTLNTTQLNFL